MKKMVDIPHERCYHFIVRKIEGEREFFMVSDKITITNPKGLHLRSAGIFCKEAMRFKSLITFGAKGSKANAKSVLSVLGACVKCGDVIELSCEGEDEEMALEAMKRVIETSMAS